MYLNPVEDPRNDNDSVETQVRYYKTFLEARPVVKELYKEKSEDEITAIAHAVAEMLSKDKNGRVVYADLGSSDFGRPRLSTSISRAPNSVAAPYGASRGPLNRQETPNGPETRIDMYEREKSRMPDFRSLATSSTVGAEVIRASSVIPKDDDRRPAMPNDSPHDGPDESKFITKLNITMLGINATAAFAVVSSSSSDSPFLHCSAAAAGIGFLGSFWAIYVCKKSKTSRILSKIGAIGAASAVIIALGSYLPKDPKWSLNIVVPVAPCLISAVVVAIS